MSVIQHYHQQYSGHRLTDSHLTGVRKTLCQSEISVRLCRQLTKPTQRASKRSLGDPRRRWENGSLEEFSRTWPIVRRDKRSSKRVAAKWVRVKREDIDALPP